MKPEKWEKIKQVFDEAINLSSDKRDSYIKEKLDNNQESINEVLSLLESYNKSNSFLENAVSTFIKEADENDPLIGRRIGNYKILKPIAQGGMGTVYLGLRDDEQFKMKVAIKLIRLGLNSEYIVKRFENERQTLASLDHPNIAKIFDGGKTEDNVPYFVMEYIEGMPIDVYCREKNLSTNQALQLFKTVCSAVHYAHQNLIIHRDIKPGNILITPEGIPKLLDFGIAKMLDEKTDTLHLDVTQMGAVHFTPEYASPEQIKNENVTTASDIYSLGILLYKLLAGFHPYKINKRSNYEINKAITDEEPEKPSTAVARKTSPKNEGAGNTGDSNHKLKRILKGDLDNIVLMAIRKEPQRRYASVEQFSEDIRRHLNGLPVIATKDTITYRASKFIKRHKVGVAAGVVINLLIFAAIIAIIWQANIAAVERDNAKSEAKKSNEVRKFVQEMLSSVDPWGTSGKDVKVYEILENASKKIDTELQYQPELQAEISSTIGNVYFNLGLYKDSFENLSRAEELKKKTYGNNSVEYAVALKDFALLLHYEGNLKDADSLYKKSVYILRNLNSEEVISLVESLNDYGIFLTDEGKFTEGEKNYLEALELLNNHETGDEEISATITSNLAINLHYQNQLEEAEKLYREVYQYFINKYGSSHPFIATAINNLAFVSIDKKEYTNAEKLFAEAFEIKLKLLGENHPSVGQAYQNWGGSLYYLKEYKEAEKKLKDALKNYDKSLDSQHSWIAATYHLLGKVYIAEKELDQAELILRKALVIKNKAFSNPDHFSISLTESELGHCLLLKKKYKEAEKLLSRSYTKLKNSLGEDNENTINARQYLVVLSKSLDNNN